MKRQRTLTQLLRHGPLSHRELVAITGWTPCIVNSAVKNALTADRIRPQNFQRRRCYVATTGRLDGPQGGAPDTAPNTTPEGPPPDPHGSSPEGPTAGNSNRPHGLLRKWPKGVK